VRHCGIIRPKKNREFIAFLRIIPGQNSLDGWGIAERCHDGSRVALARGLGGLKPFRDRVTNEIQPSPPDENHWFIWLKLGSRRRK
jgi:hypothetical protein